MAMKGDKRGHLEENKKWDLGRVSGEAQEKGKAVKGRRK